MNSEQFQYLEHCVETAIEHIVENGFDDIFRLPAFRDPVENLVICENIERFKADARSRAIRFVRQADLRVQPIGQPRHLLIPKDEFTFRRVSWIDPFDLVCYLTVAVALFRDIEAARINRSLNIIHSHRKSETGGLFDQNFGYDSFRARSGELTRNNVGKWKVVTDISNFFDRIGNHPLENHLRDSGCDRHYVGLIREILLYWAGDRRSFGIPVGSDASRILCEAALLHVDRQLVRSDICFIRYVDDYRFFVETRSSAYHVLSYFTDLLAEEGLQINHKKTHIAQIEAIEDNVLEAHRPVAAGHEPIDTNEVIEIKIRNVVSGRSSYSKYYKRPGEDAVRVLAAINVQEYFDRLPGLHGEAREKIIRDLVKYFLYVDPDLNILRSLLRFRLTTVYYIVDALIKDSRRLNCEQKREVRDVVLEEVEYQSVAYPYKIPIIRLCAESGYFDGRVINSVVENHRLLDQPVFLREALFIGFQQLSRANIRKLAVHVFPNSPPLLQRIIYFCVKSFSGMDDDERRPLLRNLEQGASDWFIRQSI